MVNQIRVKFRILPSLDNEEYVLETTYNTRYGSFKFLVTITPIIFSTLMNLVFFLIFDKFVIVYLDDIVVYSKTLNKHVNTYTELSMC